MNSLTGKDWQTDKKIADNKKLDLGNYKLVLSSMRRFIGTANVQKESLVHK